MKRKAVLLVLIFALAFALFSCGDPKDESTATTSQKTPDGPDPAAKTENIINVYLIMGQSNAVGYGMDTDKAIAHSDSRFTDGFENVLLYGSFERWNGKNYDQFFSPVKLGMGVAYDRSGAEIGIASAVSENGEMNAIIKCAQGATHLYPDTKNQVSYDYGTWTPPSYIEEHQVDTSENPMIGNMYRRFEETAAEGIRLLIEDGYTPVIKGVWWMQGEAEMFTFPMASAYRELLEALIEDTRETLTKTTGYDCSSVPFVCGLPKWNTSRGPAPAYQGMVRTAMTTVTASAENVACVDCMPLNQHDDWHFDAAGQKYLGEHFIAKVQSFESNSDESLSEKVGVANEIALIPEEKAMEWRADLLCYNESNNYQYGFIIVPTQSLTENGIDGQYIKRLSELHIHYQTVTSEVHLEQLDGEFYDIYFTAKLSGISYENLNTSYTAIAYIKDTYGGYYYSSPYVSDSIARLSSERLYDDGTDTKALLAIVNEGLNAFNRLPESEAQKDSGLVLTAQDNIILSLSEKATAYPLRVSKSIAVDYFVKYTSLSPETVSVNENGVMTAKQVGNASILVECAGKELLLHVTVEPFGSHGVSFDGEISEGEYAGDVLSATNGTLSAEYAGMIKNNNFYAYFRLTHGEWSARHNDWWMNDNVEFKLNNGLSYTVIFYEGVPTYSANITHAVTKTVEKDGKLVTVIELCIENVPDVCQFKVGMNGACFGWLGALWHDYCNLGYVSKEGIIVNKPLDLGNGFLLDGVFDEELYTENVKSNTVSATANGAAVEMIGTLTEKGVVFGVTVRHKRSPQLSTGGNGDWYTFMNTEFHFNDREDQQFIFVANNTSSLGRMYSYCKTVSEGDGYLSTIEIFIPYESIGVSNTVESLRFTASGWFETGWCWMLNSSWLASHTVSVDGLSKITK